MSGHVRPVVQPLPESQPLLIQAYDPEYYVQFSLPDLPQIWGADGCDMKARLAIPSLPPKPVHAPLPITSVAEKLAIDIGAVGADEVRITCGGAMLRLAALSVAAFLAQATTAVALVWTGIAALNLGRETLNDLPLQLQFEGHMRAA